MKVIEVVIADDHRIVRAGLRQVLAEVSDLKVIAEASNGKMVLQYLNESVSQGITPHVLLLDIALPEMDGLEVLQWVRKHHPTVAVLMLSTYPEKQYAVHCIRHGAAGYLNKSADADDLIAAIRKAAMGGVYVTPATAEAMAHALSASTPPDPASLLSHREYQVYKLLIVGQGVTQIGAQLGLASNTVSTYRSRILEKTGAKNDVELALYAERWQQQASRPPSAWS